jgi:hypothetical protein
VAMKINHTEAIKKRCIQKLKFSAAHHQCIKFTISLGTQYLNGQLHLYNVNHRLYLQYRPSRYTKWS